MGAQHCPLGLHALWGLRAAEVVGGASPGGVACHRCEGRLVSGAVPPQAARPLERAAGAPRPVCPGCGPCGREEPAPAPQPAPLRAGVARCGAGRRASPGGGAFHHCEGPLVSGAGPPLAARPLERAARVPRPVCPGCGPCGRGDPAPAPQRAPLQAGVARCGGGRRASPGGDAFHHCEGRLRSGAVPPPTARPLGGLLGSATHVLWARVGGSGGPTLSPWPACPVGAACCGAGGGPSPGGLACHRCEGRLVSCAVPPPAARPLERASGVSANCVSRVRSLRAWGPSTGPTMCALAGRRCSLWGWRKGVPGGGAFHHCEGRLRSGAVPPPTARPLGGLLGSATHVLWARVCGCGGPILSPWPACPVGAACRGDGGGLSPGRGGLPPLCGASGVRRCLSPDRPSSGVGSRGSATRVSRVRSVRAWGPRTGPTVCALASRRCSLWGWRKGVPGGDAFHHCDGRLRSGAVPPPTARPLGGLLRSTTHVLWARVCGCGGPTLSPWPACPVGAACRGGGGGPSPGGVGCHRCEGRLVSGAVPPPAFSPLERAAGAPRPVCPGCGRCGRGDPAPAPQRAPLRACVARCGGGGRASPGGVPSAVLRGVCGQALPLPPLPPLLACCWGPSPTCRGRGCVGVWAQHCPLGLHALWPCAHTTGPTHPTVAPSWWVSATATGSSPHAGLPLLHARATGWC